MKFGNNGDPTKNKTKGDHYVGEFYVKFNQEYENQVTDLIKSGEDKKYAEENAPILKDSQNLLRKWEKKDDEVIKVWKKMNSWVMGGFNETLEKLDVVFDSEYFESETYLIGKEIVEKGLKSGLFFKKQDNSVWVDLTAEGLDEKILISGLASSDPSLRSLIATLAVANGGKILEKACKDTNPKVKKSIADTLRNDVDKVDERIENIAKIAPDIIVRWLKSRYDQDSSELRWSMIENNSVNPRLRSKLIEQMEGRSDVNKQRLANLAKGNSILVNVAAKNLSASIDELEE